MITCQLYDMQMITGAQIRAARALLRWTADQLAGAAKLGVATIRRAELIDGEPSMTEANNEAIRRALESAGVEFTNGDAPGVKLRKRPIGDATASIPVKDLNASNDERRLRFREGQRIAACRKIRNAIAISHSLAATIAAPNAVKISQALFILLVAGASSPAERALHIR
jgi:transcriptional regulator with XRE-family HTH domain